jgi:subfamily B ATP-binding cassette protein MsbA
LKTYGRMLRWIRPYLGRLVISIGFTVVFSLLSSATIVMVQPVLKALFGDQTPTALVETAPAEGAPREAERTDAEQDLSAAVSDPVGLRATIDSLRLRLETFLLRGSRAEALWRSVWAFFFIFLAKNLTQYVSRILTFYVAQRVIKDMRDALFRQYTRLPLGFFHRYRAGELISRATNDVQIANKCVNVSFTNLIRDPILIVAYLGLCLYISWQLTLLALLVLPLSIGVIVQIGKRLRRYSFRQQEQLANLTSVLHETVYGIRVVKAFVTETAENRRFLRESERHFAALFKIARMERLSSPLSEMLSASVGLFILWYGGRQVLVEGELSASLFLTFMFSLFSMVKPIKELGKVNNALQEGVAAAERIFAILDQPPEVADHAGRRLPAVQGAVEFRNVSFGYDPDEPVLRDIDLRVAPGEVVALVGSSGAGKSTLVDLIPRFYDPDLGQILIDGQDVREFSLESLRRAMGIVTQEVILFNDTIAANIAYGLPDSEPGAIQAAARAANAHDFIMQTPRGYDTWIGDRGTRLSGGQRQRLSIARAILKNPPILILDEATSALDTESEQLVQEAIDRLVHDRTTFVIAHRLSTIQNAHRIFVLRRGRIVESGNHDELLAAGGHYADLYHLQFRDTP